MDCVILVIDAYEERGQRLGRLLTLAGYRPMVVSTPYIAFERALQEQLVPQLILLGQRDILQNPVFARLLKYCKREVPIIPIPGQIPQEAPLYAEKGLRSTHTISANCVNFLTSLESFLPAFKRGIIQASQSLVMNTLPAFEIFPRISRSLHSRNSHFQQSMAAAYDLLGEETWKHLIGDVGLAHYREKSNWPANDDLRTIPADYLSYLHQAVAFSAPQEPAQQLRHWSTRATAASLQKRKSSFSVQAVKLLPQEAVMRIVLNGFVHEMNEVRGEDLHLWTRYSDGSYWIVHYSNLYVYGRLTLAPATCHVWIASLEQLLHLVGLHRTWRVYEKECSCTTLTGHCLFVVEPISAS